MSLTGRYRERKYNASENDRLLRALSQPVQAWDKSWALHSNSKTFQTYKWVKSERPIEFEEDEESEPEVDLMETTQQELEESKDVRMEEATKPEAQSTEIPSEPTITNKPLNAIQQEQTEEEEKLSHTPKLDDISDEEPEQTLDNDDDDNDVDNMNDPSKHPAIAHAEAHMTDDDLLTDSAAATPSFTENDTPMPNSLDEIMEKSENKDIPPSPTTN